MKAVIIVPTYNETENIELLIEKIFSLIPQISILVVDDNSSDGTDNLVKESQNKFSQLALLQRFTDKGFGKSYIDGFKKVIGDAECRIIIMIDADFSHDPKEIPQMIAKLTEYDVIIGSRYIDGGKIENWSWRRRLLSRFANFYVKTILGVPISDMTTGFMCFNKLILKNIDLDSIKSEGYAFLVELKYKMFNADFKFLEHPITFTERREGQSKMSFKNIWEAIWLPWRLKFLKN